MFGWRMEEEAKLEFIITVNWCREDGSIATDGLLCDADGSGPHYGRPAIEKSFADGFKQFHFSNHVTTPDQYSPHVIGTAGNEAWAFGEWSMTIQGKNGGGPMQIKGNWGAIFVRERDGWKARMVVINGPPPEPAQTK